MFLVQAQILTVEQQLKFALPVPVYSLSVEATRYTALLQNPEQSFFSQCFFTLLKLSFAILML